MPNRELGQFLGQHLDRLQTTRPLGEFIDAQTDALSEKILGITRSATVAAFPCRLCAGGGFLVHTGKICSVDESGQLQPVTLPNGSAIVCPASMPCPRCFGMQFDVEDLAAAYSKREEVAA